MFREKFTCCLMLFFALLLTGCSNDKFTIEGTLTGAEMQNIKIVYTSPLGVQTVMSPLKDGKFKMNGTTDDYTVVYIYTQQQSLLAHILMKNGDKVKLEGDVAKPYEMKISGTDANERWSAFMNENAKNFSTTKRDAADVNIEKYIKENKDDIVSTLLLLNDYSKLNDEKKVSQLLNSIDEEARPEVLINSYKALTHELSEKPASKKIYSLSLYSSLDSIEIFNPTQSNCSVIYFWSTDDKSRGSDMDDVKTLSDLYGKSKRLQLIDITLDNDTTLWKRTIHDDAKAWKRHYWAVGGFMNNSIKDLYIHSTPTVIVTDSTGRQLYRGNSVKVATNMIRSRM